MAIKKKYGHRENCPNSPKGHSQTKPEKNNDDTTDTKQKETEVVAEAQIETEVPVANLNEENQSSGQPKKGVMERIANKFGYVKKEKVVLWIENLYNEIVLDMDAKEFESLSLKKKIDALREGVVQLKLLHSQRLKLVNEDLAEAKVQVDTAKQDKEKALLDAETAKERAIQAEKRAENADNYIEKLCQENNKLKVALPTDTSKSDISDALQKNNELSAKIRAQEKSLNDAKSVSEKLQQEKNELNGKFQKLQTERNDLKAEHDSLLSEHVSLQEIYNSCKARCDELEASEVGLLAATISSKEQEINTLTAEKTAAEEARKEIETAKEAIDQQLKDALLTIVTRDEELKDERMTSKELRVEVKGCKKEIEDLRKENGEFSTKIDSQKTEIETYKKDIDEKQTEVKMLSDDNKSLRGVVSKFEKTVNGLEQDKATLTADNKAARRELGEKADFILAERDALAQEMMSIAKSLCEAAAKDFLGCCDDAFESNRVNLQEKVLKPIKALEREMEEIVPNDYASCDELVTAYHSLIRSQFDEASGLTRIAQWYAYSQVAFMVDMDRSDGLFIRQQEIRDIYTLAVRLMSKVGIEYSLPALYCEQMSENSPYADVTGQRQLNIEYMCPTARSHKENVDCIDNSQVIIDVVEVGFVDNKGNNKKSQVII